MSPAPKRNAAGIVIGGLLAILFLMCCIGAAVFRAVDKGNDSTISPIVTTTTDTSSSALGTVPEPTPAPAVTRPAATAQGTGSAVAQLGAPLSGAYQVDYVFSSWCGIAHFLKANATDGARLLENINECSGDTATPLSGSTVVHLSDVTMVRVENTRGEWTLKFTPIG